ncbi:MAG: potassium transporter Kup [Hyphomonadaceae bacterium]
MTEPTQPTESTDAQDAPEEAEATPAHPPSRKRFVGLALGSMGVVFGDIGTSPLYAMREALAHADAEVAQELAVVGVVSLVFWALILIVTIKYVLVLMRADNNGEGGTLALMALAQRSLKKRSTVVFALGVIGAALFYGDGIITPAVSVMGALEGLAEAPGFGRAMAPLVLPLSLVVLVGLFMIQSRGTARVGRLFGPVTLLWFIVLGALGLVHISDDLSIFRALSPHYGIEFLVSNGAHSFVVLGSVFLVVTGAEALYADMGHFGRGPIRVSWFFIVLPCLVLNYMGQGAMVLAHPEAAENPFFRMIPENVYWPVLLLATAAAVIASQAVISGAFSLTQQAVQLGLLPRLRILRTSETEAGQIYAPQVNWLLLVGVVFLVLFLQSSSRLAAAYGIAVTGAMFVDTLLMGVIVHFLWKQSITRTIAYLAIFAILDLVFLGSNMLKIPEGAWLPLALGLALVITMWTWRRGVRLLSDRQRQMTLSLSDLIESLAVKQPHRVEGTAVYLTAEPDTAPVALLHNLKHNRVLHAQNIIMTIETAKMPRVEVADRVTVKEISPDFKLVTVTFGFMETPNLPEALVQARKSGLKFDIMSTSFFLSRRSLVPSASSGMPLWQDHLFIFLSRNAGSPADFFRLPAGRVIEMGAQVVI